jgi:uncharacterized membrane protein
MAFACSCGAVIPEGALYCPRCGKRVSLADDTKPASSTQDMAQNVAAVLSYFTFIPAVIFLSLEPYSRNSFIRFHAWQSIFLSVFWVIVNFIFSVIAVGGQFFIFEIKNLIDLLFFILWVLCLVKASQNQIFKIPFLGDLAQQQANSRH